MKLRRLLLVEDDAAFRGRLSAALERRRLIVRQADHPAQAIELAGRESFDGAVIDLRMPGGCGLEVVGAFRAMQPAARIIVLTGYGSIATAMDAVRLGAADYLTKPADADQVLAALRGEARGERGAGDPAAQTPSLERVEWEHIHRVLAETGGNISRSARMLGLDRRSLQRKLRKYPPAR